MKPIRLLLLATLLSAIATFFILSVFNSSSPHSPTQPLDTILKRGSIRVGYVINPPALCKDPNSGELSGIYFEATEAIGKKLNLSIDWVEETGWSTMIEGLASHRYDMVVGGIWPNASRAKRANFSVPLYYSVVSAYCRPNETRFKTSADFNTSETTIAVVDGETSSIIAATSFPKAKIISLPQDTPLTHLLLYVKTGKADVTFVEKIIATDFLNQNPNSVKDCFPENPFRAFGNTILFPKNHYDVDVMINTALEDLLNSGEAEIIIQKYETVPGVFYRRTPSFMNPHGH